MLIECFGCSGNYFAKQSSESLCVSKSLGAFPLSADFEIKIACRVVGPFVRFANYGALAQLGERLICIQEVRSSILLGSTRTSGRPEPHYQR